MKIICVNCIKNENLIKAVVRTDSAGYGAYIVVAGKAYHDEFNIEEPFDRKTHVFHFGESEISEGEKIKFYVKKRKKSRRPKCIEFTFTADFADESKLIGEYDSGFAVKGSQQEEIIRGVKYTCFDIEDKNGSPVKAFTLDIDTKYASLYVGTPGDGYKSRKVKAKLPDMIEAAVKNDIPVAAAMNADFFDMFGDFHPSGLCVKNSRVVANPDSERPFVGILKDGSPVITDTIESPGIVGRLDQAASGLQMIVKEGKIFDFAPLEPFSFVRHPRTAAGVRKDGSVIMLAVDGRIPEYSNGATLVDLAKFMINAGADRALNLDGGGSTAVYIKNDDGFELKNYPADLFRPRAKLIRKEFNSLLVISK